jgi:L-histidine N-alpha-methyltransferase
MRSVSSLRSGVKPEDQSSGTEPGYSRAPLVPVDCLGPRFQDEFGIDVVRGLSSPRKSIPSKYFYDPRGSALFDAICELPEYYPTRTEIAILRASAESIMSFFSERKGDLVEIGCGSDLKIRQLLDRTDRAFLSNIRYVPIDISADCLNGPLRKLSRDYAPMEVRGLIADFTRDLEGMPAGRKMIAFFGSTFGNFMPEESIRFLRRFAAAMTREDRFLIGIDMVKPVETIEAAYNDAAGVTAEFNLNILRHLNRRFKADLDTSDFEHVAFYDTELERIEMHLRAKKNLMGSIPGLSMQVSFSKGETILTEISQKFSRRSATERFRRAGFRPVAWHMDAKGWFSLVELQKTESS